MLFIGSIGIDVEKLNSMYDSTRTILK